jgi:hypothetical protein
MAMINKLTFLSRSFHPQSSLLVSSLNLARESVGERAESLQKQSEYGHGKCDHDRNARL